jgi:hypothetical protein
MTPSSGDVSVAVAVINPLTPPETTAFISEIDYDQPSTDTAEWIELCNSDPVNPAVLDGLRLDFINGSTCALYGTKALDGFTIPAGGCIVFGVNDCASSGLAVASNAIQNGAPDGVALMGGDFLLDSVMYEYTGGDTCGLLTTTDATDFPDTGGEDDPFGSIMLLGGSWVYTSFGTPCEPNEEPIATEGHSWGSLKSLYR